MIYSALIEYVQTMNYIFSSFKFTHGHLIESRLLIHSIQGIEDRHWQEYRRQSDDRSITRS